MVRRDIDIDPSEIVTLCREEENENNNNHEDGGGRILTQDSDNSSGGSSSSSAVSSIVYFADDIDDSTHEMRGYLSSDSTKSRSGGSFVRLGAASKDIVGSSSGNSSSVVDKKESNDRRLLPSAEDARMYAATMLKDSRYGQDAENRRSESFRLSLSQHNKNHPRHQNGTPRQELFGTICVSLIRVSVGALVLVSCTTGIWGLIDAYKIRQLHKNNHNHNQIDTSRFQDTIRFLSTTRGISNGQQLSTRGTPQNRAAKWIADVDPIQRDVPMLEPKQHDDDDFYSIHNNKEDDDSQRFVQRYVLALLYFSMSGNEWHDQTKFLTGEDECAWYHADDTKNNDDDDGNQNFSRGVTCRAPDLLVRELYLPENHLRGSIPSELMHLSQLDLLSFRRNSLSGTIPEELGQMKQLRYLDLGFNEIDGTLPEWLGSLNHLEVIGLSSNFLQGSIPSSFMALTDLTSLTLEKNQIQGNLSPIRNCKKLQFLYLGDNLFEDVIDDQFLRGMDALVEFDARNNKFQSTAGVPSHLVFHPTLTLLDLSNNRLRGPLLLLPAEFKNRTLPIDSHLEYLSLRGNYVSGPMPREMALLTQLTHLDVAINSFTGVIPNFLGGMEHLRHLFLGHNAFTPGWIPDFFSNLQNLQELSIPGTQRIGKIPGWFHALHNLHSLDLQKNYLNGTIPSNLWEDVPQLTSLFLNDNFLGGALPDNYRHADKLEIVALHKNTIGGSANPLCEQAPSLKLYTVNCDMVHCKHHCCPRCCWKQDSASCFDEMLLSFSSKEEPPSSSNHHHNHVSSSSFGPPLEITHNLRGDGNV